MTNEELREKILELPEPVQDHIFDESNAVLNEKIIDRNGIPEEKEKDLFQLLKELLVKDVRLNDLLGEIRERFGYDEEQAKALARDIAGFRLLPLDTYLGDVEGYVRTLGGDVSAYPETRVKVEVRTVDQAVGEIASSVGADVLPHRLKSRLEDVARSYFSNVRTAGQLFEILTRSEKIGGLGLDRETARRVVEEVESEAKTVIIAEEKPESETAQEAEGEETELEEGSAQEPEVPESKGGVPAGAPTPKKNEDFATITKEDEEEVAGIAASLSKEMLAKSTETDEKIKASVDELYAKSGVQPATEDMQNRLKKIIENRLRDVRDAMETLEILTQPKELGGMSLPHEQARKIVGHIEDKLNAVHERHQVQVKEERSSWVGKQTAEGLDRVRKERAEEDRKQEEAYASAVSKSKKVRPSAPTPPPRPAPRPAPPVPDQKPPAPSERPKVEDVKYRPKLTGPLEELQSTTLEDFRRLSKDPKEAALKIKDKIDLLGEEAFSKKMQGIDAWNRSDLYRLYMEMMREALEGNPMEQVVAQRKEAGKPALSKEEIGALSELSARLRY